MYRVIRAFNDMQDGNHAYAVGDNFPVRGQATPERVAELSSANNKRGMPLIEAVSDGVVNDTTADFQALAKENKTLLQKLAELAEENERLKATGGNDSGKSGGGDTQTDTQKSEYEGLSVDELKEIAKQRGIDIGRSNTVSGIIKKIEAAENQ